MNKAYTTAARRLVIANPRACNVVHRMAAGSEFEIESILNDVDKMCVILRNVTRVKIEDISRMVEAIAATGVEDRRADYNDVQTVLMQNYAQNKGR
ncbi:hypothetical protein [Cypionkella sp. TWP1-2-1b2]|uniref:hypothetical protein n=1 Tax=Cypionkella sp. TWP1-2-1b2 TaxID=2804675 RepID=UPI003CF7462E